MTVKLLTEHQLEFLSSKEAAQARLSLHISKCHIVGNLVPRPNFYMSHVTRKHFFGVPLENPPTCLQVDTDTSTSLLVFDW